MHAIDDLQHEHEAIGRVLTVLESQLAGANEGLPFNTRVLRGCLDFLRGFADKCHHGKEESALFPLLASKNPVLESGPVKVLTGEHEAGRHLLRELESALPGIETRDARAVGKASRAIELYTRMLRRHIAKENGIVFVLARSLLSDDDVEALERRFEAIEEEMGADAHERFEALIAQLETSVSSAS
jgi:hemerythrin-like domain-containing protein